MATRVEDWLDALGNFDKVDAEVEEVAREMFELRRNVDILDRQIKLATTNMTRFSRVMNQASNQLSAAGRGSRGDIGNTRHLDTSLAGLATAMAANTAATATQAAAIAANTATLRSLSFLAGASVASRAATGLARTGGGTATATGGMVPRSSRPVPSIPLQTVDDTPRLVRRNEREMRQGETHEQTLARTDRNRRRADADRAQREKEAIDRDRKEHDFGVDHINDRGVRNVPIVVPGSPTSGPGANGPNDASMRMWNKDRKFQGPRLAIPTPLLPMAVPSDFKLRSGRTPQEERELKEQEFRHGQEASSSSQRMKRKNPPRNPGENDRDYYTRVRKFHDEQDLPLQAGRDAAASAAMKEVQDRIDKEIREKLERQRRKPIKPVSPKKLPPIPPGSRRRTSRPTAPGGSGGGSSLVDTSALEKQIADEQAKFDKIESGYKLGREKVVNKEFEGKDLTDPAVKAAYDKRMEKAHNSAKGSINSRARAHKQKMDELNAQLEAARKMAQPTSPATPTPPPAAPTVAGAGGVDRKKEYSDLAANMSDEKKKRLFLFGIRYPGGMGPPQNAPTSPTGITTTISPFAGVSPRGGPVVNPGNPGGTVTPPDDPWFPLFPPGSGRGGRRGGGRGGRGGAGGGGGGGGAGGAGGSFGGLGTLIPALVENTIATRLNTITMNRMRIDQMRGARPGQPGPDDEAGGGSARLTGLRESLNAIASSTAAASASLIGFTALADPGIFSTFTGSVKLLGQEIGFIFAPVVKEAAFAIQGWRDTIAGLDPETKASTASIGKWVLAIGLGITAMRALGAATGVTWAITQGFSLLWKVNPFGALITGAAFLAGGIYELGKAFGYWGQQAEVSGKKAADAINEANPQGAVPGQERPKRLAELHAGLPPEIKDAVDAAKTNAGKRNVAMAEAGRIEEQIKKEQEGMVGQLPQATEKFKIIGPASKELGQLFQDQLENYRWSSGQSTATDIPIDAPQFKTLSDEQRRIRQSAMDQMRKQGLPIAGSDLDPLDMRFGERKGFIANKPTLTGFARPPKTPEGILPGEQQVNRLTGILDNLKQFGEKIGGQKEKIEDFVLPGGVQARYTDPMAYRESVQLAALNKPDTQTELLKGQLEHLSQSKQLLESINRQQEAIARLLAGTRPIVGR